MDVPGARRLTASVWAVARSIPTDDDESDALYRQNIQATDLNALNTQLAAIKWTQLFGSYEDRARSHQATYTAAHPVADEASLPHRATARRASESKDNRWTTSRFAPVPCKSTGWTARRLKRGYGSRQTLPQGFRTWSFCLEREPLHVANPDRRCKAEGQFCSSRAKIAPSQPLRTSKERAWPASKLPQSYI